MASSNSDSICNEIDAITETDIHNNLVYLTKHITNLDGILIRLVAKGILSVNEHEMISNETTTERRIYELLKLLQRKDLSKIGNVFMLILKETGNGNCVEKLTKGGNVDNIEETKALKSKWWPYEMHLPRAFYERKRGNNIIIEEIATILLSEHSSILTISGLGGVGKSTMAKWYSKVYQTKYDYIIWIDCGEGSLLKSFTSLARVLKLEYWKEMELKELATGCFDLLDKAKCLWIYDNASCYFGSEGVADILPEKLFNFDVIITSREKDWRSWTVLPKIQEFLLEVFDDTEAISFMKNNLTGLQEEDTKQLGKLCEMLGNLPLALQIAISTIQQKKIPVFDYIERITHTGFDFEAVSNSCETNINSFMDVSLDIIRKRSVSGKLAYNIMLVLGFISPENIPINFFAAVENKNKVQVDVAVELLEKYSLVATNKAENSLSINRIFQQVIRQHGIYLKNETITKILNCQGFLEYKLIPYCSADDNLQNKFSAIKLEFIEKLKLRTLLRERRFQAAVELSRIYRKQSQLSSSDYNYAYCLNRIRETKEAKAILEKLYEKVSKVNIKLDFGEYHQLGVFPSYELLTGDIVAGQLIPIYLEDKQVDKAIEVIRLSGAVLECSHDSLNYTINLLKTLPNCSIFYNGRKNYMSLTTREVKSFKLWNCYVDEDTLSHNDLHELELWAVKTSPNVFKAISCSHIRKLTLKNMTVDMSDDFSLEEVVLQDISEFDWKKAKWIVNNLVLNDVLFIDNTKLKVRELTIEDSTVDLSVLPNSVEKLCLQDTNIVNVSLTTDACGDIALPTGMREVLFIGDTFKNKSGGMLKEFNIPYARLNRLTLHCFGSRKLTITMATIKDIPHIEIKRCNLIVNSEQKVSYEELTLEKVTFLRESKKEITDFLMNRYFDFSRTKKLKLKRVEIDLSEELFVNDVYLWNVTVQDWQTAKWNVQSLTLKNVSFVEATQMTVKHMNVLGTKYENRIDLQFLPSSIITLNLRNSVITNFFQHRTPKERYNIESLQLPYTLQDFTLDNVEFEKECDIDNTSLDVEISHLLCHTVKNIQLICNDSNRIIVELDKFKSMQSIDLSNCILLCNTKSRMSPVELKLVNINLVNKNSKTNKFRFVNDFVDFGKMEKLYLDEESILIDMSSKETVTTVNLIKTKVWDWKNIKWDIKKLILDYSQPSFQFETFPNLPSVKLVTYVNFFSQFENEINRNNDFLSETMMNFETILLTLVQDRIISEYGKESIKNGPTEKEQKCRLLSNIKKKGPVVRTAFLKILRETSNHACADALEKGKIKRSTDQQLRAYENDKFGMKINCAAFPKVEAEATRRQTLRSSGIHKPLKIKRTT